jgi:hypothetical protein
MKISEEMLEDMVKLNGFDGHLAQLNQKRTEHVQAMLKRHKKTSEQIYWAMGEKYPKLVEVVENG